MKLKKYILRVVFKGTRLEHKMNRKKELRLREINKQIDKLAKEIECLFPCQDETGGKNE